MYGSSCSAALFERTSCFEKSSFFICSSFNFSVSQSIFGWAFCGQACLVFSDFSFQPIARKRRKKIHGFFCGNVLRNVNRFLRLCERMLIRTTQLPRRLHISTTYGRSDLGCADTDFGDDGILDSRWSKFEDSILGYIKNRSQLEEISYCSCIPNSEFRSHFS